jgi:hypothetical protein
LITALLRQKAAGKARDAGFGDSKAKTRNAAGRLLARNPEGRGSFRASLRCSSLTYICTSRSSRLALRENDLRRSDQNSC